MGNNSIKTTYKSDEYEKQVKSYKIQKSYDLIKDNFSSYDDLQIGLRRAGLEASQLIVGIDFTKSNTWQGGLPYYANNNLHSIMPFPNPYQQVLTIMCTTLEPFDDDNLIPAYGFGDAITTDKAIFPFLVSHEGFELPCYKLNGVLEIYNRIIAEIYAGKIIMSGPTSFAPLIYKAIEIVRETKQYHILLIVCDGAVNNKQSTIDAIVAASNYPLSIVCVGVGKGPWDIMEEFDDDIPARAFDNFQFVDFYKIMKECENQEVEFARHALMEIPDQYEYIKANLL